MKRLLLTALLACIALSFLSTCLAVDITVSNAYVDEIATFTFTGTLDTTDFTNVTYTWSWDDETADTVAFITSTTHTYATEGSYNVSLVVTGTPNVGGDWNVSGDWSQTIDSYSADVTVTTQSEPTETASQADEAKSALYGNMYVAIGLVGTSLIVLSVGLLVTGLRNDATDTQAMGLGILSLIVSVITLVVGFLVVSQLEGSGLFTLQLLG